MLIVQGFPYELLVSQIQLTYMAKTLTNTWSAVMRKSMGPRTLFESASEFDIILAKAPTIFCERTISDSNWEIGPFMVCGRSDLLLPLILYQLLPSGSLLCCLK